MGTRFEPTIPPVSPIDEAIASADVIELLKKGAEPLEPETTDVEPSLPPPLPVRAVIFDVYGTLFVSGSGDISLSRRHRSASPFERALEAVGVRDPDAARQAQKAYFGAIERSHAQSRSAGVDCPEVDVRRIWEEVLGQLEKRGFDVGEGKRTVRGGEGHPQSPRGSERRIAELAIAYENEANPVWPMRHCRSALSHLASAGYLMGIVSNAQFFTPLLFDAHLGRSLEQLGFSTDLCVWSFAERVAKPSPRLFGRLTEALRREYRLAPNQAIFVGNDMLNDIAAAEGAGLQTCLFAGDRRSLRLRQDHPECRDLRPAAVATDLEQLKTLLPGV